MTPATRGVSPSISDRLESAWRHRQRARAGGVSGQSSGDGWRERRERRERASGQEEGEVSMPVHLYVCMSVGLTGQKNVSAVLPSTMKRYDSQTT